MSTGAEQADVDVERAAIDALWRQVAGIAQARVLQVEAAVRAIRDGHPDARLHQVAAVDECHKLVGSLDSYGRHGGSTLALRAASLLECAEPDLPALAEVLVGLRAVVWVPTPTTGT